MQLAANTDVPFVRLHIHQLLKTDGSFIFTDSYTEDVYVALTQRSPLP